MEKSSTGMTWLKYGCGGCLGLIVLCGLAVAVLVGVASIGVRSAKISETTREPTLPRDIPPPPDGAALAVGAEGRIVLDLRHTGFKIGVGSAGSSPRVEASYDTNAFELVESMDPAVPGANDQRWVYRVSFHRTRNWVFSTLQQLMGAKAPSVRVFLPPDRPIALELRVDSGAAEVDLGGSWITEALVEFERGGFQLDFGEPLRHPMERLTVRGSMGGFDARHVGNASPREAEFDFSMGGLQLDLTGPWERDASIVLRIRRGGAEVRLPKDLRIEGVPGRPIALSSPEEIARPTLRFTVEKEGAGVEFN